MREELKKLDDSLDLVAKIEDRMISRFIASGDIGNSVKCAWHVSSNPMSRAYDIACAMEINGSKIVWKDSIDSDLSCSADYRRKVLGDAVNRLAAHLMESLFDELVINK